MIPFFQKQRKQWIQLVYPSTLLVLKMLCLHSQLHKNINTDNENGRVLTITCNGVDFNCLRDVEHPFASRTITTYLLERREYSSSVENSSEFPSN